MRLYIVRHGEAHSAGPDAARALNTRGIEEVERLARHVAAERVVVDQIRHSGKRRAAQTAEILAAALQPAHGVVAVAGLHPDDDIVALSIALCEEASPVMLVSHMPLVSELARLLLGGDLESSISFSTATMATLERQGDRWSLVSVVKP